MHQTVLIAGGSGFIGSRLTQLLLDKGYDVAVLSRKPHQGLQAKSFYWNPQEKRIDSACLEHADIIINLAGSNIAEKPWTEKRKRDLFNSRINSAQLLFDTLKTHSHKVKCYIGASAIGFYNEGENLTEESSVSHSFLGSLCEQWEKESNRMNELNIGTSVVRIGLVMSPEGGMLKEILKPLRFGIAPVFGNGNQWQSWIHIDDLCGIIIHLFEHKLSGIYNGVAPNPVRAKDLINAIQLTCKKRGVKFYIPVRILKLIMGSRSEMLLANQKVSSEKITATGYVFRFSRAENAVWKDHLPD